MINLTGIKVDWLSSSLPRNYTPAELPDLITSLFGMPACLETSASYQQLHDPTTDVFRHINRKRNYYLHSYRLESPGGGKLVEIYIDPITPINAGTTLVQVTGFALSNYAGNPLTIDVPDLFRRLLAAGGKPTAIHLAMDDTAGVLPWEIILDMVSPDNYKDRIVTTSRRVPITLNGETVYIGNRSDRTQLCLYRKDRQEGTKFRWVRVEYRTTDRPTAKAIAEHIAGGGPIGALAAGLIHKHLDFKGRSPYTKYNRPTCEWWVEFLGGVERMQINRDLTRQVIPKRGQTTPSLDTVLRHFETHLRANGDVQSLVAKVQDLVQIVAFDRSAEPLPPEITNPLFDATACADGISF